MQVTRFLGRSDVFADNLLSSVRAQEALSALDSAIGVNNFWQSSKPVAAPNMDAKAVLELGVIPDVFPRGLNTFCRTSTIK